MSWWMYTATAVLATLTAAGGIWNFLKRRRKDGAPTPPSPSATRAHDRPGTPRQSSSETPPARRGHIPPRIVSASGPSPPRARPLEPEIRPGLPGAQPRVAKEASAEEVEAGELEDMAREAISSTRMMVGTLLESGKDVSAALRQLAMAEALLEKGQAEESLRYASKAMDVAESLEAEQERCPQCHADTKPRWRLCPKCGHPLK